MINYDRTFDSVSDCVAYLTGHFAGETCKKQIRVYTDSDHFEDTEETVLRYLYRGECGEYGTTLPSIDRLGDPADLDVADRQQINKLVEWISDQLIDFENGSGLTQHDATGLLQHLGLPTKYIDFTQCIDVAAAFASCCPKGKNCVRGCICVLDAQTATVDGPIHLAKLHPHHFSGRANRQRGFGVAHLDFPDLRSPEAIAAANAQWFDFPISEKDREQYRDTYWALLEPRSDPGAGLLRWLVNTYVATKGKLRPRVAQHCVERIPMVPLVARPHTQWQPEGLPRDVEFLLPVDFVEWDERRERLRSLQFWSASFTDTLTLAFPPIGTDGIVVFPSTHNP